MTNPFADWKPEQQCFGRMASDVNGWLAAIDSTGACKWCAEGWIRRTLPLNSVNDFLAWVNRIYGSPVCELNDREHYGPNAFAALWDEFEASKESTNA